MLVLTKEEWLDHLHNPTNVPLENVVELPRELLEEVKKPQSKSTKGKKVKDEV